MKPFRVVANIRNNRLIRLREELGMKPSEIAEKIGINYSVYIGYEGLKRRAFSSLTHEWVPSAKKVAAFHGVSCEWIWPEEVREIRAKTLVLEANARELVGLPPYVELEARQLEGVVRSVKALLTPMEQKILERRIQTDEPETQEGVGGSYNLSKGRVSQMEMRAVGTLRDLVAGHGVMRHRKRLAMPIRAKELLAIESDERKCKHPESELRRTPSDIYAGETEVVCRRCHSAWYEGKADLS